MHRRIQEDHFWHGQACKIQFTRQLIQISDSQRPSYLDGLSDIEGIPINPKVRYLSYLLSATKSHLYQATYKSIARHLNAIQDKLKRLFARL